MEHHGYIQRQKGTETPPSTGSLKTGKLVLCHGYEQLIKRTWLKEIKVQMKVRKETD